MLVLTLLISLAVLVHTDLSEAQSRIAGGSDADISQYPHQISIRFNGKHICGGSIYQSNIIITAAHCVDGYKDLKLLSVVAGSSLLSDVKEVAGIKKKLVHEKWNSSTIDNDIAIVILDRNLDFDSNIQPIRLCKQRQSSGLPVTVIGWGLTKPNGSRSDRLQKADLKTISNNQCEKIYPHRITESMLCAGIEAGDKGPCSTDSGGPLIFGNELIGVVSWGGICGKGPDVYASIPDLYNWIIKTVKKNSD